MPETVAEPPYRLLVSGVSQAGSEEAQWLASGSFCFARDAGRFSLAPLAAEADPVGSRNESGNDDQYEMAALTKWMTTLLGASDEVSEQPESPSLQP